MALGYLARKFPESYNISFRVFNEIKLKYPDFKPNTFLDFGAGTSPSSFAFNEIFPESKMIFAVEPNQYMNKIG